jgi:hypothetical protein
MDELWQQIDSRRDGSPRSSVSEQEQLGNAILSMKEWYPDKTASQRADFVMIHGYVDVSNGSH